MDGDAVMDDEILFFPSNASDFQTDIVMDVASYHIISSSFLPLNGIYHPNKIFTQWNVLGCISLFVEAL